MSRIMVVDPLEEKLIARNTQPTEEGATTDAVIYKLRLKPNPFPLTGCFILPPKRLDSETI